jgi:hypothetical protein
VRPVAVVLVQPLVNNVLSVFGVNTDTTPLQAFPLKGANEPFDVEPAPEQDSLVVGGQVCHVNLGLYWFLLWMLASIFWCFAWLVR